MKVAIIGYGFVGKALEFGLKNNIEISLIDPNLGSNISELKSFEPNVVFICVPTPMNKDGSQDLSILEDVSNQLKQLSLSALIVLKSTVLPSYVDTLDELFSDLVYNPEFLRERSANKDFINSELIIFGGSKKNTISLENFYNNHTNCVNNSYKHTDLISASLIKYSINTFLSTKVIFFNELYNLFNKSGSKDTWENFINIISIDSRIGNSHMQVPGPDGKLGFGGPCFPKDSNAFYSYSEKIEEPLKLLKETISINNQIRKKYSSIDKRELEQNINYDVDHKKQN
jgi:nucleotide sugar dehydrogenase